MSLLKYYHNSPFFNNYAYTYFYVAEGYFLGETAGFLPCIVHRRALMFGKFVTLGEGLRLDMEIVKGII